MRNCKRFALAAALCLLWSAWVHAGPPSKEGEEQAGQGYVFFAPGAVVAGGNSVGTAHFGGGAEALVYQGLGIGAELGYHTPWEDFSSGIGILSINGSYNFNRTEKLSPFVTGGYSLAFRNGHANLVNFGGGVNYWFREKLGLRLEFRDHLKTGTPTVHYISARIGLAIR